MLYSLVFSCISRLLLCIKTTAFTVSNFLLFVLNTIFFVAPSWVLLGFKSALVCISAFGTALNYLLFVDWID